MPPRASVTPAEVTDGFAAMLTHDLGARLEQQAPGPTPRYEADATDLVLSGVGSNKAHQVAGGRAPGARQARPVRDVREPLRRTIVQRDGQLQHVPELARSDLAGVSRSS